MKHLYLLILLVFTLSCKSENTAVTQKNSELNSIVCPENGVCAFKVLQNKSLAIKTDGLGDLFLETVEGKKLVLKFEYSKNHDKKLEDGSYREEVFLELNPNDLKIETKDLVNQKLYFARWCYCKGETGYYKIKEGLLKVEKLNDGSFQLYLSFKIDEVPQVVTQINETFSLQ
ncbi:hypothetical protein ABI125_14395 [Tamlana crocina]